MNFAFALCKRECSVPIDRLHSCELLSPHVFVVVSILSIENYRKEWISEMALMCYPVEFIIENKQVNKLTPNHPFCIDIAVNLHNTLVHRSLLSRANLLSLLSRRKYSWTGYRFDAKTSTLRSMIVAYLSARCGERLECDQTEQFFG